MRFVNGSKNNDIPEEQFVRMPSPCGTYNGAPMADGFGGYQPRPQQQGMPPLPTGYPTGGATAPMMPSQTGAPVLPSGEQVPTTLQSTLFTPGFLRTQIGKRMRVEFLIGTGTLLDRTGTLLSVGASYILLRMVESDDIMMCDIYSIKFVTILL